MIDRFLNLVFMCPMSGCWIWGGCWNSDGYGKFHFKGKTIKAHRAAWMIFKGRLSNGKEIDHLCNNRACVNPAHLEVVSRGTNCRRIYIRRKLAKVL